MGSTPIGITKEHMIKGTIENWSTLLDPWSAPEIAGIMIQGTLNGKSIRTNVVAKAEGKVVTTKSRSVYQLGTPDPKFVAYLVDNGYPWDPENPIRKLGPNQERWKAPSEVWP